MECISRRYRVKGVVQGVGFRPFIYNLAHHHKLKGYVYNDGEGVEIVVEGLASVVACFEKEIASKLPPLARVDKLTSQVIPLQNYDDFTILTPN